MTEANYAEPNPEAIPLAPEKVSSKINDGRHSEVCLNCGERTPGNFCPTCGQANDNFHVSTWKIVSDFVGDYLTVDLKFFKSVLPLIFKPGFLTREFCAGRRLRYISPFRLYLFISFVYFFLLPFYSGQLLHFDLNKPPTTEIPSSSSKDSKKPSEIQVHTGDEERDDKITKAINEKVEKVVSTNGKNLPKLLMETFVEQFPKIMFVLLPIFAIFLKLLYLRSKRFYAEHLIFALHFHSFGFLLLTADTLLGKPDLFAWTPLVLSIYLYWSMKIVYRSSWFKTGVKFSILMLSYLIALLLSSVAILALTFAKI
jgi:Protein of unknown function (DUF3667)